MSVTFKLGLALGLTFVYSVIGLATLVIRRVDLYHRTAKSWAKKILRLYNIKVHVRGLESLIPGKAYLYAANHASMFDIMVLLAGLEDNFRFVLKKELVHIPVFGWALKYGPYVSIDRARPAEAMKNMEKAAEAIRNGGSVLIFPEGTRTRDGKLQPFKRGAFLLAGKAGIPLVPVVINNSYAVMRKGSLKFNRKDIELVIGPPIITEGMQGKEKELQLMDRTRDFMAIHYKDQNL